MSMLTTLFWIIVVVAGFRSIGTYPLDTALTGIVCPLICFVCGAGARGSIYGDANTRILGIGSAVAPAAIALYILHRNGYEIGNLGIPIDGALLAAIGVAIGFALPKHTALRWRKVLFWLRDVDAQIEEAKKSGK